jgi:hypothetical protein
VVFIELWGPCVSDEQHREKDINPLLLIKPFPLKQIGQHNRSTIVVTQWEMEVCVQSQLITIGSRNLNISSE